MLYLLNDLFKKSPLSLVCLISKSNEFLKLKQEERIKLSSVNKWSWQISESVFVRQHWTRDWFSVEALQFLCEIVYTNLQARAKCDESGQTDGIFFRSVSALNMSVFVAVRG